MRNIENVGFLTCGGDAPGMNATARGVVRAAEMRKITTIGFIDGWEGLVEDKNVILKSSTATDDIRARDFINVSEYYDRAGTFLGSCRKFRFDKAPDGKGGYLDRTQDCLNTIERHGIDMLIGGGGDGTWRGLRDLIKAGVPCIGVPNTVDNDTKSTDTTIGFDSAIAKAAGDIQEIRNTTLSMRTVIIVVVMGRKSGALTLNAGLAGQANVILIPEVDFSFQNVAEYVLYREASGKRGTVIACSEALNYDALELYLKEYTGMEIRIKVIGHTQRGAAPNSKDRNLGLMFGAAAIRAALAGEKNCAMVMKNGVILPVPMEEAISESSDSEHIKRVAKDDIALVTARDIGICFGD